MKQDEFQQNGILQLNTWGSFSFSYLICITGRDSLISSTGPEQLGTGKKGKPQTLEEYHNEARQRGMWGWEAIRKAENYHR